MTSVESRSCSTAETCEAKADQKEQHRRAKPSGDGIFARGTVRAFALFGGDVVEGAVGALAAKGSSQPIQARVGWIITTATPRRALSAAARARATGGRVWAAADVDSVV